MSLSEHVVDNPEDYDKLLIPKSEVENDGNTRANEGEDPEDHTDQSEEKQEDENILWDGSKQ